MQNNDHPQPAVAVIIARAGSRGLAHKNLRPLRGKPLLAWTIDHALAARTLDCVALSTDCPQLARIGRARNIHVILRPPDLSNDNTPIHHPVQHAVRTLEAQRKTLCHHVVILYGNIPLRPDDLTDRALAKLRDTAADSVQSVCPVEKTHPFWMKKLEGRNHDLLSQYQPNTINRRQDLPPLYMLDGGVIAVTRRCLFDNDRPDNPHAFLGHDRRAIVTAPGEVVDVDTALDLAIAEAVLQQRAASDQPHHASA